MQGKQDQSLEKVFYFIMDNGTIVETSSDVGPIQKGGMYCEICTSQFDVA